MRILFYTLIGALCLNLLTPADAALFRSIGNWFKKAGQTIGKGFVKVAKKIAKPFCKVMTKVACPVMATLGAGAATAITGGAAAPGAIAGAVTLASGCYLASPQCDKGKREASVKVIYFSFSGDFDEYDQNGDGKIDYEEFAHDLLGRFKIADPTQLREVYSDADTDDDGRLSKQEFDKTPWSKRKYTFKVHPLGPM